MDRKPGTRMKCYVAAFGGVASGRPTVAMSQKLICEKRPFVKLTFLWVRILKENLNNALLLANVSHIKVLCLNTPVARPFFAGK